MFFPLRIVTSRDRYYSIIRRAAGFGIIVPMNCEEKNGMKEVLR